MPPKLIIAGAPASGKGTQCELIRAKFGVIHLSTGDILREAVADRKAYALQAKEYMDAGKLVPDNVIIGVVRERLREADCERNGWLLDGFPRTAAQAEALKEAGIEADLFIFLNVPDEDLIERVTGRRCDPLTHKIYHMKFSPPANEEIAARLTQRSDDTEEKVRVRLEAFHENLDAIKSHYTHITLEVDGTQNKSVIFEKIESKITTFVKYDVVFVLGGPGSGKGTQCKLIGSHYGYVHLSAGDLLRDELKSGSELAEMINSYIKDGKIVPAEVTVNLLKRAMQKAAQKRFLVDGFPRSLDNFMAWCQIMGDHTNLLFALFFDCPENLMTTRLLDRGQASGRIDDNMESIKKRFKTFREDSMPVVEYLRRLGKCRTVNAAHMPPAVWSNVQRIFDGIERIPLKDRTFAMIKPDVVRQGAAQSLLNEIEQEGFVIIGQLKKQLSQEEAQAFYAEHKGKGFYNDLVTFMSSGPVIALALERSDAIPAWRAMLGPTNTGKAKAEAPKSIRARFGTDGTQNAAHGSDAMYSAARELQFWFPEGYSTISTLAMIKPIDAETHYKDIKSIIVAHGFEILQETHVCMTKQRASEFYAEHKEKEFYNELVDYMSSEKVVVLYLQREGAIKTWRELAGPTDPRKAKETHPKSIRAMYGMKGVMNAVHGSDSVDSAIRELAFWFPSSAPTLPGFKGPKMLVPPVSVSADAWPEMANYMSASVDPVLAPIVMRALVARPPNFVEFLQKELKLVAHLSGGPSGAGSARDKELPPVQRRGTEQEVPPQAE